MSDMLTVTEAAAIKGVGRQAVHKAIVDGRLPAQAESAGPIRRVWKIRREDLDAWQPATPQEKARRARLGKRKISPAE